VFRVVFRSSQKSSTSSLATGFCSVPFGITTSSCLRMQVLLLQLNRELTLHNREKFSLLVLMVPNELSSAGLSSDTNR